VDSLLSGGVQPLSVVKDDVREAVAREKALDALMPKAKTFADAATATTFDAVAKANSLVVEKVIPFTRASNVGGLGGVTEAVGAAFGVPAGSVSAPVRTDAAVYVLRIDKRVDADPKAWESQKAVQRLTVTRGMRDQRVRLFIDGLRKSAKIDDRRKQMQAAQRRQTAS
jgi:parvulin-like peptidyl-prolyl isomerase